MCRNSSNMNTKILLALVCATVFQLSTVSACPPAPKNPAGPAATTAAPATTVAGRKKRSVDDDVTIVLNTQIAYDSNTSIQFLDNLSLKLSEFAKKQNIDGSKAGPVAKSASNIGGHFAANIVVSKAADNCESIQKFVVAAIEEIPEVTSGAVACGRGAPVRIN